MVGWRRKSYLGSAEITYFFPAGILAEAKSMTHSDILYHSLCFLRLWFHGLDISTFQLYEPLLFQFSFLGNL